MTGVDLTNWPALVLTAGLATRLRPLSHVRAKAALPVAGEALISRILRWLRASGVRAVVLNLHHRAESVTRRVGAGDEWDLRLRYSWEPTVLGSAGGPKRALPLLDAERFFIVNGDTLTDCDLQAVARQHLDTGARITMAVVARRLERAIQAGPNGVVTGFGPGNEHFIGVQAVNADVFASVAEDGPSETVKGLYPQMVREQSGSIRVYRSGADFLDVGTPADYLHTVDTIARRERRPLDCGRDVAISASAVVRHSVLWDRVTVHDHAELIDCIVADDVVVPSGGRYERCVLVHGADGLTVSAF